MTIQEYINASGGDFWRYPLVLVLMGLAESLLFIWYVQPVRKKKWTDMGIIATTSVLTGIIVSMQFLKSPVAVHSIVSLALWSSYMLFVTGENWKQTLFQSSIFCLEIELMRLLYRDGFLLLIFMKLMPDVSYMVLHIFLFLLYLAALGIITWLLRKDLRRIGYLSLNGIQLLCLLFPLLLYLVVRQISFMYLEHMSEMVWYWVELLQLGIAGCAEIVILCTGHMLSVEKERNELLKKQMLFEQRQQQYRIQEATIRAVNRKYHDLKHYIAGLEAVGGRDKARFVNTLKQEIEPFESIQKTGNEVMDILLFERIEECRKKGIRLVPYVDGRKLSFLDTMDLCAIFGNAMDNAIEATEHVSYINMREISLKIGVSDGMLIMRFQNYFDGILKRQGEKILTSKENAQEHGYGLENIQTILDQYDGSMACEAQGKEFSLHILIPLPA